MLTYYNLKTQLVILTLFFCSFTSLPLKNSMKAIEIFVNILQEIVGIKLLLCFNKRTKKKTEYKQTLDLLD